MGFLIILGRGMVTILVALIVCGLFAFGVWACSTFDVARYAIGIFGSACLFGGLVYIIYQVLWDK